MGGKLSNFPLRVADTIRSRNDLSVRHQWPRDEVAHRAMEQGIDAFNTLYYVCQLYGVGVKDIARLEGENKELAASAKTVENLWMALGKRADSLEVDVNRLAGLNSILTKERDQSRDEIKLFEAQLETSCSTSKKQAEAAAQAEIDSLRETVKSLRAARENDGVALAAANEKLKAVEEAADKDGKELVELRMKVSNPYALRKLYQGSTVHADEMEHFMSEGFIMTRDYLLRDVIKEDMSMVALRRHLDDLDYDTLRDADAAAEPSSEEEQVEGENST